MLSTAARLCFESHNPIAVVKDAVMMEYAPPQRVSLNRGGLSLNRHFHGVRAPFTGTAEIRVKTGSNRFRVEKGRFLALLDA